MRWAVIPIAMLFASTTHALEAPQAVRGFVAEQLAGGYCEGPKIDWHVYMQPSRKSISEGDGVPLLYGRKIDGHDAIVVMIGNVRGEEGSCGLTGSAGSPMAVFIQMQGERWHKAFDSGVAVVAHEWWEHKGKDRLLLILHGTYCNGSGPDECWSAQELDGFNFKEVKRHPDYKDNQGQLDNPIRNIIPDNPLVNSEAKQ